MMKPKAQTQHEEGLLEYLEDIIGSNKYVSKIEQAAQRVETANETRTEKLNRVKVVEKEREGLEVCSIATSPLYHTYVYYRGLRWKLRTVCKKSETSLHQSPSWFRCNALTPNHVLRISRVVRCYTPSPSLLSLTSLLSLFLLLFLLIYSPPLWSSYLTRSTSTISCNFFYFVVHLSAQKQEHEDKLKAEKDKARDSMEALEKHESQLKKENKDLDVRLLLFSLPSFLPSPSLYALTMLLGTEKEHGESQKRLHKI